MCGTVVRALAQKLYVSYNVFYVYDIKRRQSPQKGEFVFTNTHTLRTYSRYSIA